MPAITSLANQLLIAMPGCTDPNFQKSVIYVCEHHESGSVGLIINKPTEYKLELIFKQLNIEPITLKNQNQQLLWGGPNQGERGFVVHDRIPADKTWRSTLKLPDLNITTSNDIIRDIAIGAGPPRSLVILGYAGWTEDQLEKEIQNNTWLVCPYKPELLFEVPYEKRWEYAGLSLGVHMNQLISDIGHA